METFQREQSIKHKQGTDITTKMTLAFAFYWTFNVQCVIWGFVYHKFGSLCGSIDDVMLSLLFMQFQYNVVDDLHCERTSEINYGLANLVKQDGGPYCTGTDILWLVYPLRT